MKPWNIEENPDKLTFNNGVRVLDDFLPRKLIRQLQQYAFEDADWKYTNLSEGDERSRHWGSSIVGYPETRTYEESKKEWDDLCKDYPFFNDFWKFLRQNSPVKKHLPIIPYRGLLNCSTGGHGDICHTDNYSTDHHVVTHILYLNDDLTIDDGGQTEFYSQDRSEIIGSVTPKFGRVVMLDGRIPHSGKAPRVHYTGQRITLGIQCFLMGSDGKPLKRKHTGTHASTLFTQEMSTETKASLIKAGQEVSKFPMDMNLSYFCREFSNIIPKKDCKKFRDYYESNPDKHQDGEITNFIKKKTHTDYLHKQSREIYLSSNEDKDIYNLLLSYAETAWIEYCSDVKLFNMVSGGDQGSWSLERPKLRKYPVGGFFDWHVDKTTGDNRRTLAILMYLNTVKEGGSTKIAGVPKDISPEEGKILVMPTTWLILHKGEVCISGPKFLGVTFVNWNSKQQGEYNGNSR